MSDRLLKILGGVLAVLVVAWAVARLVSSGGGAPEPAPFELASSSELEIDSVLIASATDTIVLRAGAPWTVNGYEATAEAGESLGQQLGEARVGRLASRNPANHERLGVTSATGRRFTLYSEGQTKLSIIFGERGGAFEQVFVRREGDDEVYVLQGGLVSLVNRAVDDWRNKWIVDAVRADIHSIEFTYPDESFTLVRDSAAWRIEPSAAQADDNVVSNLLGQLAQLQALGFAHDSVADTLTWDSTTVGVRVLGLEGIELGDLTFLDRGDVGYYVGRLGSSVVYTLASWAGGQILKREEELREGDR
jgi:hypothetical protein